MTNSNPIQLATTHSLDSYALTLGVRQLVEAIETGKARNGAVYRNVLTVSFLAAFRTGKDMVKGENDPGKAKSKYADVTKQFRFIFVEHGNAWYAETDDAAAAVRGVHKSKRAAAVREYFTTYKGGQPVFECKEVLRLSRKIFDDSAANHPDVLRTIAGMESAEGRTIAWADHVRDNYGAGYNALVAFFKGDGKDSKDWTETALDKISKLDDPSKLESILNAVIARQAELAEMAAVAAAFEGAGEEGEEGEGEGEEAPQPIAAAA